MTRIGILNAILEILFISLIFFLSPFTGIIGQKLVLAYIVVQLSLGRYRDNSLWLWDEIRVLIVSHSVFFVIGLLLFPINILNVVLFGAMVLISFCFSVMCNRCTRIFLRKYFKKNTIIIGAGKTAKALGKVCKVNRFALTDVKAYINCNNSGFLETLIKI